ncbi:hypothetical protein SCUP234_11184 [Seiridium cupressi]|uniref:Uncharacterized protein n=1 Tax=Seiridium unicorne TaxID=138068 RepID=A0ABR2VII6_9PEZI
MADNQQQPRISSSDFKPPTNYDQMTDQEKKQTYMEWAQQKYNEQYEAWMPWIEDHFLKYFTKDNKASYATKRTSPPVPEEPQLETRRVETDTTGIKEQLDKSKVTGVEQVDTLQDGVHGLVAGQVGQGGLLQPVGDLVSKEGVNRAERQGKDDKGGYLPSSLPSIPGLGGSK